MNLSKKQLALGLVLLFTLGLALTGCGGGGTKAEEVLKIGSIQDMSGTTSVFGNAITRGAELAIEKINAQGGVNGKKLKLITLDTKGDPKEAINAYNRLVDQEKVVAVLGPPISNIGLALAPIANAKKVPVVGSFIDPRVTVGADGKPQPAMFLMQPSSVQYAEIMAGYAVEKLGLKKVGIFYNQSNAYSVSLIKPFKDYAESLGAKVVVEEKYTKDDKDYKTQLAKIKEAGADVLYAPNYTQELIILFKQRKQAGVNVPIVDGLDLAAPFAQNLNDPEAADNAFFANNFSEKEPQLVEVRNAYKAKYNNEEPINKAYLGYDKILIIVDAIKKMNSTKPEDIIKGLEQVKNLQGTTGVITLSPKTHQPVGLSMVISKIEKGKYVEVGRYVPEKHKK
ncbi:MAG: ABC transporter substrate-binding protein [Veillonellaceae bacterium]|nr:ABC transporter substrate-binding protein [Veillonellaceae bacterium]